MKTLSWNVRGLGNSRAVHRLRNHWRNFNPQIMFMMKTRLNEKIMEGCVSNVVFRTELMWGRMGQRVVCVSVGEITKLLFLEVFLNSI